MRIRIIDAFTDRPFTGNPAAVCLLDTPSWPAEDWIQLVAAGMHLSGTASHRHLPDRVYLTGHAMTVLDGTLKAAACQGAAGRRGQAARANVS